jgi:hypothetical protein
MWRSAGAAGCARQILPGCLSAGRRHSVKPLKYMIKNVPDSGLRFASFPATRSEPMSINISSRLSNLPLPASVGVSLQGAGAGKTDTSSSSSSSSSVEAEFLKFAQMTPEERVQKAILDKLGMTEEQFNKLDPKAKADVMTKIREEMLKQMEAKRDMRVGELADIRV